MWFTNPRNPLSVEFASLLNHTPSKKSHRLLSKVRRAGLHQLSSRVFPTASEVRKLFKPRKLATLIRLGSHHGLTHGSVHQFPKPLWHTSTIWFLDYLHSATALRLLGNLPTQRLETAASLIAPSEFTPTKTGRRIRRKRSYRPKLVMSALHKKVSLFKRFISQQVASANDGRTLAISTLKDVNTLGKLGWSRTPRVKFEPFKFLGLRYFPKTLGQTPLHRLVNSLIKSASPARLYNPRVSTQTCADARALTPKLRRKYKKSKWSLRRALPRRLKNLVRHKTYSRARKVFKNISKSELRVPSLPTARVSPTLEKIASPALPRIQLVPSSTSLSGPKRQRLAWLTPRLRAPSKHKRSAKSAIRPSSSTQSLLRAVLPPFKTPSFSTSLTHRAHTISISPSHSLRFKRTPFFFVNLLTTPSPSSLELLSSRQKFTPKFRHHLFPTANQLKTEIFRRLNRQKSLSHSRSLSFNKPSPGRQYRSYMYPSRKASLTRSSAFSTLGSALRGESMMSSLDDKLFRPGSLVKPIKGSVHIKRVRFKPGYGRIWRAARDSIRELLNLPSRYQYRLTPKLHWQYMKSRQVSRPYSSISLDYLLMFSHFIPDFWSVREVIANDSVFLNGSTVSNANVRVFVNDLVQLTVSVKFYITLRWLKNWSIIKRNRVNKIYYRKYRPSGTNRHVRFVRTLPSWFFDLQFSHCDVPKYVEVDFFTLSVFVIHDKLPLETWTPVRANLYNPSSLNMYNWKYIT